jgi:hypothetical protein
MKKINKTEEINEKINKDTILTELLEHQRKNISSKKKLQYNDLKRISNYLNYSIFNNNCSLWNGCLINNKDKDNKGYYINFYFKGKKIALHRLLYYNFIGELYDNEYIKFKCDNKGKCCCVNHIYKLYDEKEKKNKNVNKEEPSGSTSKTTNKLGVLSEKEEKQDIINTEDLILNFNL